MLLKNKSGATLIELVVTVAAAGILAVLVFAFYINVIKGFWSQARKSEGVKEMIVTRAKINKEFGRIATVTAMRNGSFDYIANRENGASRVASRAVFKNKMLMASNDTIAGGLDSFVCSVMTPVDHKTGQGLLLWEARIGKDRWIAGAKEITIEDSVFINR
jgi:Tfp pilus assembly protein PilE